MTHSSLEPIRTSPRAMAIAKALRQAARHLRSAGPAATVRGNLVIADRRWGENFHRAVRIGFYAAVLCPVLLAAVYFVFIASDRYVSTAQFTVRAGEQPATDALGGLAALANQQPVQDAGIVANYIGSNDMIGALDEKLDLRAAYSRPGVDYFSKADASDPAETFNRYWNRHIDVQVDNLSNVVTVSVQAFTPQDALAIARGVLRESEKLVNRLSDRARADTLRESMATLGEAQTGLEKRTRAVRDLRDRSGIIDPTTTGDVAAQTLGHLQESLANLEVEYSSQLRWVTPGAPQMAILERRIGDLRRQMTSLENQVAGSAARGANLAESTAEFDKANLDLTVAQQQYVKAVAAVEAARADADSQRVYVLPFEEPTLAEEALYPRRLLTILAIAAICLALWGSGVGIAVLARNNMAG